MSRHSEELPLPLYGLAGLFTGVRWIEGEGWDLYTVAHRPANTQGKLVVGVDRRTTADHGRDGPRVAISADLARESVATALVANLPGIGNDVFEVAATVARDGDAWMVREIKVDDKMVSGYEREYEGMWVAYYLTPTLIVYVLGPRGMRPDTVELRRLLPDEVARRED